jgi:inorganic triphosphatase YgiF
VQLTDGAAIKAANWSFSDGNGMRGLLKSMNHSASAAGTPWQRLTAVDSPATTPPPSGLHAQETELKLRASRETLAALREHPLLKKRNKSGWQTRELLNQYFDTPERELSAARVALRLRRDGDVIIQTLKCRGQSVAGLSERNEYDWNLDKVKLDLKKLDATCWPEQLAELDKKTIKPLFTTDFSREYAEIAWGRGKSKVVIEAALDQGFVIAGKRKKKSASWSWSCAKANRSAAGTGRRTGRQLPLMPCDISKAERGYRLLDEGQLRAGPAAPSWMPKCRWTTPSPPSPGTAGQQPAPGRAVPPQRPLAPAAGLGRVPERTARPHRQPGPGRTARATRDLRASLDALLEDWRPLVQAGNDDEDIRRAAPSSSPKSWKTRWGQFSLETSRWLLARAWTAERKGRGERQGKAQLASWLGTCWAKKPAPSSCRCTPSARKTWPSSCRASSNCRPGCTTPARCWTCPKWTACTAS